MPATKPLDPGSESAHAGRLSDGTPFFGRLGVVAYDREDLVQCHLCGRWLRIVGGTHVRWHGWTIERYRAAFELRSNVPTCAPGLSSIERRNAQARIGSGGFATPSPSSGGSIRSTPPWRSLARLNPDLIAELHPEGNGQLDATQLAAGSKRKLWWLCANCGHEWQAIVANRTMQHSGCPNCAARRRAEIRSRVQPERSLAVNRPDLAAELHPTRNRGVDIDAVAANSAKRLWWLCQRCGHEWPATPANRSRGGTGCPSCWSQRRRAIAKSVPYERSLAARSPELLRELDPDRNSGIDVTHLGARSDQKLWWRCSNCGHKWLARVADRSAGTGCPACRLRPPPARPSRVARA